MIAWLAILLLAALTGIWVVYVRRVSGAVSTELLQLRAAFRPLELSFDVDSIRTSTAEIVRARSDMDAVAEELGHTLDSWTASLATLTTQARSEGSNVPTTPVGDVPRSRITVVGPVRPYHNTPGIAFANDPLAFPNRLPNGPGIERTSKERLGLRSGFPVTFVVPTLWVPPSDTTASRWAVVTEDVLGVRAVDARLYKGWPEAEVTTRVTGGKDLRDPDAGNICSFCRDVRNPVTAALLHHPRTRALFGFELGFWPTRRNGDDVPLEWGLLFPDGQPRTSPSYQQERDLQDRAVRGEVNDDTVLDDFAMLARFPNPYGEGTALIIAGIRAIGTWGAAEYIRRRYEELDIRTGGGTFVSFLRVRASYRVYPTEADGAVEQLLLVAATDNPARVVEEIDFRAIAA